MDSSTQPFVHLHVHTGYSIMRSSIKIKELIARVKYLGMNSIAITDYGVMYGVVDFYIEAKRAGIKPILGCEVFVAPTSRYLKEHDSGKCRQLVLLAENMEGYRNLMKLVSLGFTEGYHQKPRVDIDLLRKHSEGLIALSAGMSGVVSAVSLEKGFEAGKEDALLYAEIFGEGNFFLEIQDNGIAGQDSANKMLIQIAGETNLPLVATNDVHYMVKDDAEAHDTLLCIQAGKAVSNKNRLRMNSDQFYLKSPQEMYAHFSHAKAALENTQKIADRCNVELELYDDKPPVFDALRGNSFSYLKELCEVGLSQRYLHVSDMAPYKERLDHELSIIKNMGFVDYFLVVWDYVRYAHENSIIVGPGRGASGGSLVAYALRITDVDPIRYDLLFEPFLNPERASLPYFEIDFCNERRQEVVDYVYGKYGADHVAQIVTFGTMIARAAIHDVGRALGMPHSDIFALARKLPKIPRNMPLKQALKTSEDLMAVYNDEGNMRKLLNLSLRLEGLPRHASSHAASLVICDKPVVEYAPLALVHNDNIVTQFPMTTLERLGLAEFIILGSRTLTMLQAVAEMAKMNHGGEIDVHNWHYGYEDPKVYELISAGETSGVDQLGSAEMTSFMRKMQPKSLDDLAAGIALYNPGPMDFMPKFIECKNNPGKINYHHPMLKPILEVTYGCIVYREQIMRILSDLAGYSLAESDVIRRILSKNLTSRIAEERNNFIFGVKKDGVYGCVKNGIPEKTANDIFSAMADACPFSKSHAVCQAAISYRTTWLKCYYPEEFFIANPHAYAPKWERETETE